MTVASQMLDTYPADLGGIDKQKLAACIEACYECAQACTACADACLSEGMVAELTNASAPTPTAPTCAKRPGGCCPGTPATTPT